MSLVARSVSTQFAPDCRIHDTLSANSILTEGLGVAFFAICQQKFDKLGTKSLDQILIHLFI